MVKSDPNNFTYFTLTKSVHFKVKAKILRINEIINMPEKRTEVMNEKIPNSTNKCGLLNLLFILIL